MNLIGFHMGMMSLSEAPGGKLYWRIYIDEVDGGSAASLAELLLQDSAGGSSIAIGGTPFSSSQFSPGPYGPEMAFDGNNSTIWASAGAVPQYLGYQFPSSVELGAVSIRARPDGGTYGQTPADFVVQSSADGISYTDEWSVTGSTGWAASELRQFVRP